MTGWAVEAAGVEKRYGGVTALKGVDLRIPEGAIHGLIGPNGAGKSTLFDILCGITKPSGGRVSVLGMDVAALPAHHVARRGVGRTFQRTATFRDSTVRENLLFASYGRMRHSVLQRMARAPAWREDMAAFETRADAVLETCGLAHLSDQPAAALAYGTQRRLAVAVMLMNDPKILFLDEPVAGMNDAETAEFIALVRDIARGRTIVIVEHDMAAIGALCSEVLVMVDGAQVVSDTPERALAHPDVVAAYLGTDADD
ncbi:branched-chain amino acid transport system ATP-binding protein [Albimonas donghaensis]|uniref:Branched-chain amino acid transport system ATP-binding protein n=1 Tax=Albimonas donghaensis TaxID=356660 RepID=A0A1H2Y634_9RHOB|nr:ABC transporter ATP-binding protein [Albimonas donghaensis]SDX00114.1 branched-chain amino acid transport system ATP-binding protein [Albimonas donghaensis]